MPQPDAPLAPFGWIIMRHFYDGKQSVGLFRDGGRGRSLVACQAWVKNHNASSQRDDFSELAIEPVGGWEVVRKDPLAAILLAYRSGDISLSVAVLRIDELYEEEF